MVLFLTRVTYTPKNRYFGCPKTWPPKMGNFGWKLNPANKGIIRCRIKWALRNPAKQIARILFLILIHHLNVFLEIYKFKIGCFLIFGKSGNTVFFRMVPTESVYQVMITFFRIAQLKSYPMIYNMRYFYNISQEKNPKIAISTFSYFGLSWTLTLPVGRSWIIKISKNLASGVFWYGESEFDVKNPKFENSFLKIFQFRRFFTENHT